MATSHEPVDAVLDLLRLGGGWFLTFRPANDRQPVPS
jgi:hypothetical protein